VHSDKVAAGVSRYHGYRLGTERRRVEQAQRFHRL